MDRNHPIVTAMAVRDGNILAVGSDAELAACANARTQVLNLHGLTVLPGLIDIHTHATEMTTFQILGFIDSSYPGVKSIAEIVQQVQERVENGQAGRVDRRCEMG